MRGIVGCSQANIVEEKNAENPARRDVIPVRRDASRVRRDLSRVKRENQESAENHAKRENKSFIS